MKSRKLSNRTEWIITILLFIILVTIVSIQIIPYFIKQGEIMEQDRIECENILNANYIENFMGGICWDIDNEGYKYYWVKDKKGYHKER